MPYTIDQKYLDFIDKTKFEEANRELKERLLALDEHDQRGGHLDISATRHFMVSHIEELEKNLRFRRSIIDTYKGAGEIPEVREGLRNLFELYRLVGLK